MYSTSPLINSLQICSPEVSQSSALYEQTVQCKCWKTTMWEPQLHVQPHVLPSRTYRGSTRKLEREFLSEAIERGYRAMTLKDRFRLDIWSKSFIQRVVEQWNRLLWVTVDSPSLEVFKALGNQIYWKVSLPVSVELKLGDLQEVPSKTILCYTDQRHTIHI